jgi:hypothetical protein
MLENRWLCFRRMKRALIFIAGLAAVIVLAPAAVFVWWVGIRPMFYPPPPALLEHVTAAGGWFGGCPPRNQQEAGMRAKSGEALSPELNRKLAEQFPPGSPAEPLVQTLAKQGFTPGPSCENDSKIHSAAFHGPTRGAIFDTYAVIYWKTENEALVWTKGFVAFDGL